MPCINFPTETYHPIGTSLKATPETWIGAMVGLFVINRNITTDNDYPDFLLSVK